MSIRRTPRRQLVTDRIVAQARTQVMKNGWDRFSLRELARDVDLSPATLYEYFDGKEAILDAVCAGARRRLTEALREARIGADDKLHALAEGYVRFARENREDFLLVFGRGLASPNIVDNPIYRVWLNQVAYELQRGSLAGRSGVDVERTAYMLWAAAHGLAMLQLTELSAVPADFAAVDRNAIDAIVAGIGL